jgi:hypothetical protein
MKPTIHAGFKGFADTECDAPPWYFQGMDQGTLLTQDRLLPPLVMQVATGWESVTVDDVSAPLDRALTHALTIHADAHQNAHADTHPNAHGTPTTPSLSLGQDEKRIATASRGYTLLEAQATARDPTVNNRPKTLPGRMHRCRPRPTGKHGAPQLAWRMPPS